MAGVVALLTGKDGEKGKAGEPAVLTVMNLSFSVDPA